MNVQSIILKDLNVYGLPVEFAGEASESFIETPLVTKPYVHLRSGYHDGTQIFYTNDNVSQVIATYEGETQTTTIEYNSDGFVKRVIIEMGVSRRTETFTYSGANITQIAITEEII